MVIKIYFVILIIQVFLYFWFGCQYFFVPEGHVPKNIIYLHILAAVSFIILVVSVFIKIKYDLSGWQINVAMILSAPPIAAALIFHINRLIWKQL